MWTTDEVLEAFGAHGLLRKYLDEVKDGQITGADLEEMDEESVKEMFGLTSSLVVRKVVKAIEDLLARNTSRTDKGAASKPSVEAAVPSRTEKSGEDPSSGKR